MFVVAVCEVYGWTYEEYMNQPAFFLDLIREKMVRDNKERELQAKKLRRG